MTRSRRLQCGIGAFIAFSLPACSPQSAVSTMRRADIGPTPIVSFKLEPRTGGLSFLSGDTEGGEKAAE